jgi:DNA-binding NtrC family response regulator
MADLQSHNLGSRHDSSERGGPPERVTAPRGVLVPARVAPSRFLLVMTVDSLSTRPFPESEHLIVGRSRAADLRLGDPAAAPRHLRLSAAAGRLTVEDLGSFAGTTLSGAPIPPRRPIPFLPGEAITVGSTVLMVREVIPEERPQRIWSHGAFGVRIEEECERGGSGGRPFALVRLRLCANDGTRDMGPQDVVLGTLASVAPSPNAVGVYGAQEYEVLLVDVDAGDLDERVQMMQAALGRHGFTVNAGVARFPDDGATAEVLLARANQRLRRIQRDDRDAGAAWMPGTRDVWLSPALEAIVEAGVAHARPLWLLGERGSGKETLARAIHERSNRSAGPFVTVEAAGRSSAALSRSLFGEARYEGGLFHQAATGTLFIADAEDLPRAVLLRLALELHRREISPLRTRPSPRLVLAGVRDPHALVRRGSAQGSDLIGAQVHRVPSVAEQRGQLPSLVAHLVVTAARARGREDLLIEPDALAWLETQDWPGNIREVEQVIDRAVANAAPDALFTSVALPALGVADFGCEPRGVVADVLVQRAEIPAGTRGGERDRILDALAACAFNQSRAATQLGISRRTLLSRLDRLGIARPQKPTSAGH